jgi:ubiquitin-protein ligase
MTKRMNTAIINRLTKNRPKIIMKNLDSVKNNPCFTFAMKDEDKIDEFYVLLDCQNGHYKGQKHILSFKTEYGKGDYLFPITPPLVQFVTRIFHPNVSINGSICVDILKERDRWVPQYDFNAIMTSIQLLLEEPNNGSPFNCDASVLWVKCERAYKGMLKGCNRMSETEKMKLYDKCFESFDKKSVSYAQFNNLSPYQKYFPNL